LHNGRLREPCHAPVAGQVSGQDPKDEIIAALKEQNRILQDRVRELEKDKAYLQEEVVRLQHLLEAAMPKALPRFSLREKIRGIFRRKS